MRISAEAAAKEGFANVKRLTMNKPAKICACIILVIVCLYDNLSDHYSVFYEKKKEKLMA